MKISLFTLIIVAAFASCKKDTDTTTTAPSQTNNYSTIVQDNRLLGGWRLDSMLWGTTMSYSTGNGSFTDSVYFSNYSFNGNIPVSDIRSFFISGTTITTLPSGYFWDTSTLDSLYLRVGNHSQDVTSSYKFSVNGNKLILNWSTGTLNHYAFPPNPLVAISYYHK